MLGAAWIMVKAACTGWGVPCLCPPSSPIFPHFCLGCNSRCWHYTFAKFWYFSVHAASVSLIFPCVLYPFYLWPYERDCPVTTVAGRRTGGLEQPVFPGGCWVLLSQQSLTPAGRAGEPALRSCPLLSQSPTSAPLLPGRRVYSLGDSAGSAKDTPKHHSKADFCSSLNTKRAGLSSIYFSFYPASRGSSICRQYLTLPDKLHLYRLIQTQAINTRRLCTDCRHAPWVPLPGQTFRKTFGKIPLRPLCGAQTVLGWDLRAAMSSVWMLLQQMHRPLIFSVLCLYGFSARI